MKHALMTLAATLGLFLASGCGPDARYCSNCETGVAQTDADGRARLVRGRCNVNGRVIDCTREHAFCPDCRKK